MGTKSKKLDILCIEQKSLEVVFHQTHTIQYRFIFHSMVGFSSSLVLLSSFIACGVRGLLIFCIFVKNFVLKDAPVPFLTPIGERSDLVGELLMGILLEVSIFIP